MFIFFLLPFTKGSPVAPIHFHVTRVGPCYDAASEDDAVTVSEMDLHGDVYQSILSGYMNISKDIENGWSIRATMQKCHDIRDLDTCDFVKHIRVINNGCADSDEEDLYNMFFHYVHPQLECPLKAGQYKITNYPFITDDNSDLTAAESKISTSLFGYTFRLEGYNEADQRLLCIDTHLQLLYMRKHDWVGNKQISISEQSFHHTPAPNSDEDETDDDEGKEEVARKKENDSKTREYYDEEEHIQ